MFDISTTQTIGSVATGAKVTGIEIGTLIAGPRTDPPSLEDRRRFLAAVIRQNQSMLADDQDAAVRRFYQTPFYVRTAGPAPTGRQELRAAIQAAFEDADQHHMSHCIAILAESGSGKTLALKQLWWRLAEEALEHLPDARIPILINLSNLSADCSVEILARGAFNQYAGAQFTTEQIVSMLNTSILLLDGLDEIPSEEGALKLRRLIVEHSRMRTVVSVRTAAYHTQLGPAHVVLLDDLSPAESQAVLGSRWQQLQEPLQRLVGNRSLLWLLITSSAQEQLYSIPSKGRLIRELVRQRLSAYTDDAPASTIETELLGRLFAQLGFAFHHDRTYGYTDRQIMEAINQHLVEWRDPRPWNHIAALLQSPVDIVARRSDQTWRFRDRMLQSYFAAAAALESPVLREMMLQSVADPWWYEPLEILLGLLDNPAEQILRMIDIDPVAATRCLVQAAIPVNTQITLALIDALQERLTYGRAADRERAVTFLAMIDSPETARILIARALHETHSIVILRCAQACLRIATWEDQETQDVKELLRHPQRAAHAVLSWCRHYRHNPQHGQADLNRLQEIALAAGRVSSQLQGLAMIALGLTGADQARTFLMDQFRRRLPAHDATWCVVEALTQMPDPHGQIFEMARRQSRSRDTNIRARATYLLGWAAAQAEAEDLLYHALRDREMEVRRRAAQALGQLQPERAGHVLLQHLLDETDERVVDKIAISLGTLGGREAIMPLERQLTCAVRAATRRHIRETIAQIRYRYGGQ